MPIFVSLFTYENPAIVSFGIVTLGVGTDNNLITTHLITLIKVTHIDASVRIFILVDEAVTSSLVRKTWSIFERCLANLIKILVNLNALPVVDSFKIVERLTTSSDKPWRFIKVGWGLWAGIDVKNANTVKIVKRNALCCNLFFGEVSIAFLFGKFSAAMTTLYFRTPTWFANTGTGHNRINQWFE